jgi:cytochrome oxidase assembly protein ShyY1
MDDSALAYRPVALEGEYLSGSDFLLDNRINKGRFGYEVLTPFRQADSGRLVLVNRGWVVADPARRSLPTIPGIAGPQVLSGQVYVPPGAPYTLGEQQLQPGWPKVIQLVDVAQLAGQLPVTAGVFPHVVRLASAQAGALAIDWQIINTRPEKHTAYAVQWFTMAAVLGLIYVLRSSNLGQLLTGAKGQDQ